ncbi:transglycosylase SLT domain-containing protein [Tropicimonas sediminicola]|uniref:Transglycosylase SLT domain-containing protein n=1 Tax=Tropicimonas sediminicola TaxID=1031541 RepID=A0A239JDD5_9RHOB|nr:transglycosylase SLT domain-containing protein [Tropicimonas sediminicola]SNT03850.1 Transglycosylase SLT domain-containing protein [Tropicimonas sediminicola]
MFAKTDRPMHGSNGLAPGIARSAAFAAFLTLAALNAGTGVQAAGGETNICLHWAEVAAREQGVPVALMKAIATVESGRRSRGEKMPWPWTAHSDGRGHWFDSAGDAKAFISARLDQGHRNVDVGCFQVNVKWHGEHFASLDAMLEPSGNARYAARFLRELHRELGNWESAAAAYHSRTPEHAARYTGLLAPVIARYGGMEATPRKAVLLAGSRGDAIALPTEVEDMGERAMASLVPLGFRAAAGPLF